MLDPKLVRERPELIREVLRKRQVDFPLEDLLRLDEERRSLITEVQRLKHTRNVVSEEIARVKKAGLDVKSRIEEMRAISKGVTNIDGRIREVEVKLRELLLRLPNIPHKSVPIGKDESENVVVRKWGEPREFDFRPKDHIELGLMNGLIDLERAAKTTGSRSYFLKGPLVLLNYALIRLGLELLAKKGFEIVQPPYLINRRSMEGAIILSDFKDMIYKVEGEDLYLIGTAEHPLAAMHMNEVLDGSSLPLRYAGVSPCFRKEAGAHGRDTKGIFRVHQFEKVEQFVYSRPEDSWDEHERLLRNAEEFYRLLDIPYRIVVLCTGDLGKVAAKTYDIEAWLPGQGKYREIVSCSNCTDYQARRLGLKFRDKPHEEARLVHTLNSTLVATERTMIAIMENYQQKDGSIFVPKVLRSYVGFEVIKGKPL